VLPRVVSSTPGPVNLQITPFVIHPLRRLDTGHIERMTLKFSTQTCKTSIIIYYMLKKLATDPWNALHVMAREEDAESLNFERYQGIIKESPALNKYWHGTKHEMTAEAIRLNGMVLDFASARSPAALASKPKARIALDEVNKYEEWTIKEANPIKLAEERTKTFAYPMIIIASTPTHEDGYITQEFEQSLQHFYHVPCPHCRHYQTLIFGNNSQSGPGIKWGAHKDPNKIRFEHLAWYQCAECGQKIFEHHKPAMLRDGIWVPKGAKVQAGKIVNAPPPSYHEGYFCWTAYSPWEKCSFSSIASEFLTTHPIPSQYQNFVNSWLAEEYRTKVHELKGIEIRACETAQPDDSVAEPEAWVLTAGVDVQRPAGVLTFYYVIRAWGADMESWLIRHGYIEGFPALYQVLFSSTYKRRDGSEIPFGSVPPLIDSGDGGVTIEVYDFCRDSGCIPSKGASRPVKPIQWGEVERAGVIIPLCNINSGHFKSRLHRQVRSGKWHLPQGMEEEYYHHMVAEQLVQETQKKTGQTMFNWKVSPENTPNHYFDAEVLALVGADIMSLQNRTDPPQLVTEGVPSIINQTQRVFHGR